MFILNFTNINTIVTRYYNATKIFQCFEYNIYVLKNVFKYSNTFVRQCIFSLVRKMECPGHSRSQDHESLDALERSPSTNRSMVLEVPSG